MGAFESDDGFETGDFEPSGFFERPETAPWRRRRRTPPPSSKVPAAAKKGHLISAKHPLRTILKVPVKGQEAQPLKVLSPVGPSPIVVRLGGQTLPEHSNKGLPE